MQGHGAVGQMLTRHPDIAKVSFTGEVGTGKKVMADSAGSLKNITMELGGKSPLIIFDDADLDSAVNGAMVANFYTQVMTITFSPLYTCSNSTISSLMKGRNLH